MRRLAGWSFRHRWIVVGAWLSVFVILFGVTKAVGTGYSNNFTLPDTESTQALQLLQASAPEQSGDTEQIVIGTSGGTKVADPAVQAQVEAMLAEVAALSHVVVVVSPYGPDGARQVSPDGTVAFATVTLDQQAQDLSIAYAKQFVATAEKGSGNGVVVAVSGQVAQQANQPAIGGTGLGIITAGIVLFLVFGSLFAMAMPLASALLALGTAISVIGLISNVMKMPVFSTELVLLIGLGVGVDYAPATIPAKDGTELVLIGVYPTSAPQDAATTDLIDSLRDEVIPATVGDSGMKVYVGGITAIFADFATVLTSKLPLFIGVVVLMSFLLLAVVLRSLLVPLKAAIMNLLSIAAAFGILTAVFQWGWLGGLFGVSRPGPVEAFLPVMLFAILFGLSMDYEVFLVMRIHEEWLRSGDNHEAVRRGLLATGGTITAAAAIMIVVFGSFILGGERIIKEFGLGLAAAIFVDAVIIRTALVPALMLLMDKANWWFPAWLDRALPRIHVEPEDLSELDEEPIGA